MPRLPSLRVMLSSVVYSMFPDREAAIKALESWPLFELVGAEPIREPSHTASPFATTTMMATRADLFILLLGPTYGMTLADGRSATEVEFDAAYQADPTKILVFQRSTCNEADGEQARFISRVTNYYSGYWRSEYTGPGDLPALIFDSCAEWLRSRAGANLPLSIFDHFVRVAKHDAGVQLSAYDVSDKGVAIEYTYPTRKYIVCFSADDLRADFWRCIYQLRNLLRQRQQS